MWIFLALQNATVSCAGQHEVCVCGVVLQENKDKVASLPGVVPQLLRLVQPGSGEALQLAVLRLLHNLSFDTGLRQQMVQGGLVPQVTGGVLAVHC